MKEKTWSARKIETGLNRSIYGVLNSYPSKSSAQILLLTKLKLYNLFLNPNEILTRRSSSQNQQEAVSVQNLMSPQYDERTLFSKLEPALVILNRVQTLCKLLL